MDISMIYGRTVLQQEGEHWLPALPSSALEFVLSSPVARTQLANGLGVRVKFKHNEAGMFRLDA